MCVKSFSSAGYCFVFGFIISQFSDVISSEIQCMDHKRFYRDPRRTSNSIWTNEECSKYFLCLEGEVFEFKCSPGLLFDVNRQICDFINNVDNCDVTIESAIPQPLLQKANCSSRQLGCADGTCLPQDYFCDGSQDCSDGSDEVKCDVTKDPNGAKECDFTKCKLPHCFCFKKGTDIPGKIPSSMIPQMVLLTFDDAINENNWDLYNDVLNYNNPNNCPISATFFVSHQFTNYQYTQSLWNDGHEIGIHSVTHRGPEDWWSYNATIEDWFDEMIGQANILNKFSKIRMQDIRGLRVPFLRIGWNRQFLMMKEFGFAYDSSIIAPFSNPPLWPFTLDYKIPFNCSGNDQLCPTRSYPGIWEIPMNPLEAGNYICTMVDACPPQLTGKEIYDLLRHNFRRHYHSNRAPFGLYFHSTWFKNRNYLEAFKKFINEILQEPDVYFVTNWQAIEWMRSPTTLDKLHSFHPWKCNRKFKKSEIVCDRPNVCKLYSRVFQEERTMYTCTACPPKYPWIRNEFGID